MPQAGILACQLSEARQLVVYPGFPLKSIKLHFMTGKTLQASSPEQLLTAWFAMIIAKMSLVLI